MPDNDVYPRHVLHHAYVRVGDPYPADIPTTSLIAHVEAEPEGINLHIWWWAVEVND